ncbi:uncharacterized protein [Henckelia pumila]|uniref:uncharacterized protein n=1 Tax=Henckelia pumila TaxID=405737 RepID=UPI003C6DD2E7
MARRSNSSVESTPDYGILREPNLVTIKMHYGGKLNSIGNHDEYIGGSLEYFDFFDLDKLAMVELWGFAEDLGFKDKYSIKFLHKIGYNFKSGRYLENDSDVLEVRNHIPKNYEVEIFIEHLDACENVVDESENIDDLQKIIDDDDGEEDVCANSDGLYSLHDSDEGEVRNYPKFNPEQDSENPSFKLGMIFCSKKEVKFAIQSHYIRNGVPIRFVKNDNIRLWAKCKNNHCDWTIHVAKMTNDSCWQVRTLHDKHNKCSWDLKNKCITSAWLGKTFVKRFNTNPKLGTIEFRNEICGSLKADVSRKVTYLAKKKALQLVQGTAEEQFRQIRSYCAELKRSDVGTTIVLKLTEDDEEKYGGQLLSAVGLDPNNNIFPICYALVERETMDTWTWFLQLLDKDIGIGNDQQAWTFMSDKQKGLINAFESLFPDADNRFCVRHLLNNMKRDGFKSVAVKIAFWAAAKATRVEEFRLRMTQMKESDENAYEWLAKKPENQWSKAFFSTSPKCDILLNNMCESFNSLILYAREKPVIEMFEMIRNLLMARYQVNREKAGRWKSQICPKIRDVLAKIYIDAAGYYPSDEMHYQITKLDDRRDQHSVDLSSRSCSCRKYDLTGIPCKHAVCAIWCKKEDPEAYVHSYYTVETYK